MPMARWMDQVEGHSVLLRHPFEQRKVVLAVVEGRLADERLDLGEREVRGVLQEERWQLTLLELAKHVGEHRSELFVLGRDQLWGLGRTHLSTHWRSLHDHGWHRQQRDSRRSAVLHSPRLRMVG